MAVEAFAIAWKWKLHKTAYWEYLPYNHWIYGLFIFIRHLFLLSFFYGIITSPLIRKMIRLSVIPFLLFAISNYAFIQGPHAVNTYTIVLANIIVILLSLFFFHQVLKYSEIIDLRLASEFWIVFGIFIYSSGILPLFMFLNYLIYNYPAFAQSYFVINDTLNIVTHSFYLTAFLCKPRFLK